MPRPRTSLSKAKLTGEAAKRPDRFRDRANPATKGQPVGDPPAYYMDKETKAALRELARNLGWLEIEDRGAVEVASLAMGALRATVKAGELPTAALVSASRQALAALGATTADRSKIHVSGDPDDDDPFARFGMQ